MLNHLIFGLFITHILYISTYDFTTIIDLELTFNPKTILVILGPTASGKTAFALRLAKEMNGEIISADSRQIYKGMDIGTGKDLEEYGTIPYHLIDIVDAGESYNVYQFQKDCYEAITKIQKKGKLPILCGGSGLYIEAILNKFQYTGVPKNDVLRVELEQKDTEILIDIFKNTSSDFSKIADISTRKRLIRAIEINHYLANNDFKPLQAPDFEPIIYGLNPDVKIRRQLIAERLDKRLENGLIEEVQTLLKKGVSADKLIFYGLEYKFITEYLSGKYDYETMKNLLLIAIQQFAKRQMTFFRGMERDGWKIEWN